MNKAVDFIMNNDLENLKTGRININGNNVYALMQNYKTENIDSKNFESHIEYIDLQLVIKGREIIIWENISELTKSVEYNKERDVMFYKYENNGIKLIMAENCFAIFYPQDAHLPKVIYENIMGVFKIVVKIKI